MINAVIEQHAEDAAALAELRRRHVAAPHVNLQHLARVDERLAAHLDGLLVAGDAGWKQCEAALGSVSAGALFVATVTAIQSRSNDKLERLLAIGEAVPDARVGLVGAFGWVSGEQLRELAAGLLASANAFRAYVGLAACAMHRVDPGAALTRALESTDALLRARAFRTVGELGRRDLIRVCEAGMEDMDAHCRNWAACSAVRLGAGAHALERLARMSLSGDGPALQAMDVALIAMELPQGHDLLRQLAQKSPRSREFIWGSGLVGDPAHIPWLIERTTDPRDARAAGEAFSMITGLDLAEHDLEASAPPSQPVGPNDDPDDPDVRMDPDEDLPWPDAQGIASWWQMNAGAYPVGRRTFMGGPVTTDSCVGVLRAGYQRQRRVAALHVALQAPSEPLFEWRAPAWRQRRRLQ
jgi:uncharacterized protein (TIGR02270 family)